MTQGLCPARQGPSGFLCRGCTEPVVPSQRARARTLLRGPVRVGHRRRATGLGVTPASSSLSEQLAQESAAALQQLAAADAGGIDLLFVSSQVAELSRALTLLGQLEAAADAAALRAELVVLQSIVQQELSLAAGGAALKRSTRG